MGFLAFGLFLLVIGLLAIMTPLDPLGWALVVAGAVFAVVDLAVGPRGARRGRGELEP